MDAKQIVWIQTFGSVSLSGSVPIRSSMICHDLGLLYPLKESELTNANFWVLTYLPPAILICAFGAYGAYGQKTNITARKSIS